MALRVASLAVLALIAFAGNSVLNRAALQAGLIDPVSFTQIRIFAGAVMLAPFLGLVGAQRAEAGRWLRAAAATPRAWFAAAALFAYALGFSLAYVALDAGVGALILFSMVQLTMIGVGVARGLRPRAVQWAGVAAALGGLAYLVAPSGAADVPAPPWWGVALMAIAGVAWGVYTLLGKGETKPTRATARNFLLAVPFALALAAAGPDWGVATPGGVALAVASGALTSGLGYAVWYAALRDLSTMTAATAQLSVPAIAAFGGAFLLGEAITLRLVLASVLILGGVFAVIRGGR